MPETIPLHTVTDWIAYWVLFWSMVNIALPPREMFDDWPGFQKKYNLLLKLVGYYGSINIRQKTVEAYSRTFGIDLETGPGAIEKANKKDG